KRDEYIVQIGTPQVIINNPINYFVKSFIKCEVFHISDLIKPLGDFIATTTVSDTDSLEEILKALTEHEIIQVKSGDDILGILERDDVYQEVAKELENVGG